MTHKYKFVILKTCSLSKLKGEKMPKLNTKNKPMKVVFIAHPIRGNSMTDIINNMKKALAICKIVHSHKIFPVAPYLISLQYLNDHTPAERKRGIRGNHEYFRRHFIDELWLCGDKITYGMVEEIIWAIQYRIRIIPKTPETTKQLTHLLLCFEHLTNR